MNVYSVVKVRSSFPARNNSVVTSHILEEKRTFAVGPVGLFSRPRGPTFTDFEQVLSAER